MSKRKLWKFTNESNKQLIWLKSCHVLNNSSFNYHSFSPLNALKVFRHLVPNTINISVARLMFPSRVSCLRLVHYCDIFALRWGCTQIAVACCAKLSPVCLGHPMRYPISMRLSSSASSSSFCLLSDGATAIGAVVVVVVAATANQQNSKFEIPNLFWPTRRGAFEWPSSGQFPISVTAMCCCRLPFSRSHLTTFSEEEEEGEFEYECTWEKWMLCDSFAGQAGVSAATAPATSRLTEKVICNFN